MDIPQRNVLNELKSNHQFLIHNNNGLISVASNSTDDTASMSSGMSSMYRHKLKTPDHISTNNDTPTNMYQPNGLPIINFGKNIQLTSIPTDSFDSLPISDNNAEEAASLQNSVHEYDVKQEIKLLKQELDSIRERIHGRGKCEELCKQLWRFIVAGLIIYACIIATLWYLKPNNDCDCGSNLTSDFDICSEISRCVVPNITEIMTPTALPSIYPTKSPSISTTTMTPTLVTTQIPSISPTIGLSYDDGGFIPYGSGFGNNSDTQQPLTWMKQGNICIISGIVRRTGNDCTTRDSEVIGTVPIECRPAYDVVTFGLYFRHWIGQLNNAQYNLISSSGDIRLNTHTFHENCRFDDWFSIQYFYRLD